MKARDVYYKVYSQTELPQLILYYTRKDENEVILLWAGETWISFRDDHEKNIERMEKEEKKPGFMFWNDSLEGEKFYRYNSEAISKGLANMISNQK